MCRLLAIWAGARSCEVTSLRVSPSRMLRSRARWAGGRRLGDLAVVDPLDEICGQFRGIRPIWSDAGRDGLDQGFQVIGQLSLTRTEDKVVILIEVSVVSVIPSSVFQVTVSVLLG